MTRQWRAKTRRTGLSQNTESPNPRKCRKHPYLEVDSGDEADICGHDVTGLEFDNVTRDHLGALDLCWGRKVERVGKVRKSILISSKRKADLIKGNRCTFKLEIQRQTRQTRLRPVLESTHTSFGIPSLITVVVGLVSLARAARAVLALCSVAVAIEQLMITVTRMAVPSTHSAEKRRNANDLITTHIERINSPVKHVDKGH